MEILGIAGCILLGYLSVYSIIDRVCKCVEKCAFYKEKGGDYFGKQI